MSIDLLTDSGKMQQFMLETIELLHKEKQKRKIKPDYVLRSEISIFIQKKIDKALKALIQSGKIKSGEIVANSDKYFELKS